MKRALHLVIACLLVASFATAALGEPAIPPAAAGTQNTVQALSLSASNPDYLNYLNINKDYLNILHAGTSATQAQQGHRLGFEASPVAFAFLGKYVKFRPQISVKLPSSYDLRQLGRVTPVENQDPLGTCWDFAAAGSLESCLLPTENQSVSENNVKNVLSDGDQLGFNSPPDSGGDQFKATAYYARWSGPVNTGDDPYTTGGPDSNYYPAESSMAVQEHVQNVYWLPTKTSPLDNDAIKWAVIQYGAVDTSMQYHSTKGCADNYYYNDTNYTYYDPDPADKGKADHDVCIVGWNDNFPASEFTSTGAPTPPPGNGAYIVKNSWGTDYGDSGYFYVSYYDVAFGYNEIAVFPACESPNNYSDIYQYDYLGDTDNYGYKGGSTTAWAANVFMAKNSDALQAVSSYFIGTNISYQVQIYVNPVGGTIIDPDLSGGQMTGSLAETISGSSDLGGYLTIDLPNPVALQPLQEFAVVIEYTTPGNAYPIPIDKAGDGATNTAEIAEGFVSQDGNNWEDVTSWVTNGIVCIKAFAGSPTINPVPIKMSPSLQGILTYIDGTLLQTNVPSINVNGHLLVPMSSILKALGATVQWNATQKTITATKGTTTVVLKIGNLIAYKNGVPFTLLVAPRIVNGHALIPSRFVSEALGYKITYDASNQRLDITSHS